ncbi:flagellar biosynthetic protein FliR [Telmatospirillum siberiense]|uniref:Flagellar type III secretion system protein FliR n=1 Tax=Telmatospirillum siberiense TaxID=382514 RepID=A0A2N3Q051_9PROT|nr:flagellar biosynthetic protein FliR [Telmatospirillum siberiense]PKU26026.1 flagellar type III secretion system protein FliR [Telmatospirillum siberiense]
MLREMLASNVYAILLIFARFGAAMMLFPGLNSTTVPVRFRLLLAAMTAFLVSSSIAGRLPPMPPDFISLLLLIAEEITVGLFFGIVMQVLIMPIDVAGSFIGYSVGLTNMFTSDPVTAQQNQLLTGMLNLIAVNVIFLTDSHHLMFQAVVDSYSLFVPGQPIPFDDLSQALWRTASDAMLVSFKLAAPSLVFALTFNTGLALLNRLVPQMQVFFVGMPMQILGGLGILGFCMSPIMTWFLRNFSDGLLAYMVPR